MALTTWWVFVVRGTAYRYRYSAAGHSRFISSRFVANDPNGASIRMFSDLLVRVKVHDLDRVTRIVQVAKNRYGPSGRQSQLTKKQLSAIFNVAVDISD